MKTSLKWIALATGVLALAAHAQQAIKPENQVKLRKSAYALMNYSLDTLEAMAEGKRPYVKDEAVQSADVLAQIASLPQRFFGEGTYKGETRAASGPSVATSSLEKSPVAAWASRAASRSTTIHPPSGLCPGCEVYSPRQRRRP